MIGGWSRRTCTYQRCLRSLENPSEDEQRYRHEVLSMMDSRFVRKCAVTVATAGLILGALGHAAPAMANPSSDDTDYPGDSDDSFYGGDSGNSGYSIDSPYYGPDTYAGPGYDYAYSGGPGGDTTVFCAPCA